jgi:hypothetical protein
MTIDVSQWTLVEKTANSSYYLVEEGVLAAVPNEGARDDVTTARENVAFQNRYLAEHGGGVVVVFFDRIVSQDREARRIYQSTADPAAMLGSGFIGGTALARAIASFSLGFTKQRIPVKMFPDLDEALVWARQVNRAAKERR